MGEKRFEVRQDNNKNSSNFKKTLAAIAAAATILSSKPAEKIDFPQTPENIRQATKAELADLQKTSISGKLSELAKRIFEILGPSAAYGAEVINDYGEVEIKTKQELEKWLVEISDSPNKVILRFSKGNIEGWKEYKDIFSSGLKKWKAEKKDGYVYLILEGKQYQESNKYSNQLIAKKKEELAKKKEELAKKKEELAKKKEERSKIKSELIGWYRQLIELLSNGVNKEQFCKIKNTLAKEKKKWSRLEENDIIKLIQDAEEKLQNYDYKC